MEMELKNGKEHKILEKAQYMKRWELNNISNSFSLNRERNEFQI